MKRVFVALMLLCVAAGGLQAQEKPVDAAKPQESRAAGKGQAGAKGHINAPLRAELLQLMQQDQDIRLQWIKKQSDAGLIRRMREIDARDTTRMKEIVKQYGWPGKSLVGKDGANAAWILVQHADQDKPWQRQCLDLMQAAPQGEVAPPDLALLTDRVLLAEGKKQIYGTQFIFPGGKLEMRPTEDEANLDKRRKGVGLMPIAEYRKLMIQAYHLDTKQGEKPGK